MNINEKLFQDTTSTNTVVADKNISVELPIVKKGNKATVTYNGLLNNCGAEKVYLHFGFDGWKDAETIPMYKNHGSYNTEIRMTGREELNFCFKDNADNWDNNSGKNWTIKIHS